MSLHYYQLKPTCQVEDLELAFRQATRAGLFELPGLQDAHLLQGIKGERCSQPAALWIYRDRRSWEQLWGTPEKPIEPDEYPDKWLRWEQDLLAPLLRSEPDKVEFTSYQVLTSFQAGGQ